MGQRVLVFGGRNYTNQVLLWAVLDLVHISTRPIDCIIHGACPTGADYIAAQWAKMHNVALDPYPAAWDDLTATPLVLRTRPDGTKYNAAAGGIRNQVMATRAHPNLALGFAGGTGTADMLRRLEAATRRGADILIGRFP